MIIGISGKIGSGKDTIGKIIQYLYWQKQIKDCKDIEEGFEELANYSYLEYLDTNGAGFPLGSEDFIIKKFADTLKDTVCLWTGCTREQLEDADFKDKEIGEDWVRYGYSDGFEFRYKNGNADLKPERVMNYIPCDKETYERQKAFNWQTAYREPLTYRKLLQLLGTECMRNTIHINGWVNSLFSEYKFIGYKEKLGNTNTLEAKFEKGKLIDIPTNCEAIYPNWIITDMRFPNELEAVKKRGGISIRINRTYSKEKIFIKGEEANGISRQDFENARPLHPSETALDDATFDYTIENNGTIEELIKKVKKILINNNIIV